MSLSSTPDVPDTLSQALTQKIRELLKARGWSQREFAEQLGVTQGAVSYLLAEKRRAEVLDYYERLAQVFGVPLSVLIHDLEQRVAGHTAVAAGALPLRRTVVIDATVLRALSEALHALAQREENDALHRPAT